MSDQYDYQNLSSEDLDFLKELHPINQEPVNDIRDQTFHPFPRLPAEIRIMIWAHALRRPRLISMQVSTEHYDLEYTKPCTNHLSGPQTSNFYVFVNGYQLHSNFLRVCREFRVEALKVYRVHIPCAFVSTKDSGRTYRDRSHNFLYYRSTPGTLYYNPENDVLHIKQKAGLRNRNWLQSFIRFVSSLKTIYDPRHVGLLNLVLEKRDIQDLFHQEPLEQDPPWRRSIASKSFQETMGQLRQFWLMQKKYYLPRNKRCSASMNLNAIRFTVPRVLSVPTFELLEADPRNALREDNLGNVLNIGSQFVDDPRELISLWQTSFGQIGVQLSDETNYRVMYTDDRWYQYAWDKSTTNECLEEYRREHALLDPSRNQRPFKEDMQTAVRPAVGFWLLPLEAFSGFKPYDETWRGLSGFRPQLALSKLPQ